MFTQLTQLQYQGNSGSEHIWAASTEVDKGYRIAATALGSEIVRVRLLRSGQQAQTRYQLVDNVEGTLPYHSWMVTKGDEQWPQLLTEGNIQNILTASDQQNKKTKNNLFLEPDPNSPELVLKSLVTIPDSDHTNIEIESLTLKRSKS